jgi:hypothetical protein
MAQYPKRWARRVWESAQACEGKDRMRLEALLRQVEASSKLRPAIHLLLLAGCLLYRGFRPTHF